MRLIVAFFLFTCSCYSSDDVVAIRPCSRINFSELSQNEVDERMRRISSFAPSDNYEIYFNLISGRDNSVIACKLAESINNTTHNVRITIQAPRLIEINFDKPTFSNIVIAENGADKNFRAERLLEPIIEKSGCCVFNMCMPFLAWPNRTYAEKTKKKGRLAHKINIIPPDNIIKATKIHKVEVYIDKNFDAILEASALDANNNILSKFSVSDFKKFNNIWSIKSAILSTNQFSSTILLTDIKI